MGTDKDLENSTIYKAKLGNNSAFEELVRKYQKSVKVFAYAFFNNIDIADEISQEVFIKVFENLKKLRDVSNFKKWLFKIARNTCISYYRKSKKHKDLLEFNEPISVSDENIEDKLILREDIKTSLLKLSSEERKAIILVSLIGFSYKEASEILNCPLSTVATRVNRANKKLIKNLS